MRIKNPYRVLQLFCVFAIAAICLFGLFLKFQTQTLAYKATTNLEDFENIIQTGGGTYGIDLFGDDKLIVSQGPRLVVFDISDPSTPTELGKSEPSSGLISELVVIDNYVYAISSSEELLIYDISSSTPVQISSQTVIGIDLLHKEGNRLYVGHVKKEIDSTIHPGGFIIYDVSNPSTPVKVIDYDTDIFLVYSFASYGDYLYVALGKVFRSSSYEDHLFVFDNSNPDNPTLVSEDKLFHFGQYTNINIHNGYLIQQENGGIRTFDLTDPENPTSVALTYCCYSSEKMVIEGDIGYLRGQGSLYVLDISDPTDISAIDSTYSGNLIQPKIQAKNGIIYEASGFYGLNIYHFQTDTLTHLSNYISPFNFPISLDFDDQYTYVVNLPNQFEILDTADLENPSTLFKGRLSNTIWDISVQGDYAYMAAPGEILIYEISNPVSPTLQSSLPLLGWANGRELDVMNNTLVVTESDNDDVSVYVVDITDPMSPTIQSEWGTRLWDGTDVIVQDDVIYLIENDYYNEGKNKFVILDNSVPGSLTPQGIFTSTGSIHSFAVEEDLAFLGYFGQINIVDIQNPNNPTQIGTYYTGDEDYGVGNIVIVDDYLIFSGAKNRIDLVDISDPTNPAIVGTIFEDSESVYELVFHDGVLFVAAIEMGVFALGEKINTPQSTYDIFLPFVLKD